ncbi:uncharacterized protein CTHT_0011170 [Thermochaetoides thermophila DSM 1495]|uniref:Mitochondrial adapter protein MCP1 transmembrane domain-containing protein n=1 Tax=Chaetomium thermophilum (strain DSM 1495 / CBS 144.50 / IMI 039719) TaxID=759272 RepID=G0S0T5_CHATD|nr:hypothetical protein CTHT_0011170 [Thermochaetoides thermophila DSM 1495]EGS22645.1 hypothetical protein CTHT_0011170 [Thermochaetoides thermophila DSM 1495]
MDHRRLSVGTLVSAVSLVELDPAPIAEDAVVDDAADAQSSGQSSPMASTLLKSSSTSTSIGLSGSSHGPIFYLTRIQRYSSYTFTLFSTLHLATTSLIPLAARSVASSESYLLLAREIYQTPLSEPLLVVLPAAAHVASGLALRLLRRKHNLDRYYGEEKPGSGPTSFLSRLRAGWPTVTNISVSGFIFTVSLAAHAFVNRGLPLLVEGDSANVGLAFVAHGFARHPVISYAAYGVLLVAGCGHMVWGWAKWAGLAQGAGWGLERVSGNISVDREARRKRRRRLLMINGAAAVAIGLWAVGGIGIVAKGGLTPGWVGNVYDGLYDKLPLL